MVGVADLNQVRLKAINKKPRKINCRDFSFAFTFKAIFHHHRQGVYRRRQLAFVALMMVQFHLSIVSFVLL